MEELIRDKIKQYVLESKENFHQEIGGPYYEEPIVQFAEGEDAIFQQYKKVVSGEHLTPQEAWEGRFGVNSWQGGTVISIALPIQEKIRKSNRVQQVWPSKEWALLRAYGDDVFLTQLRGYLIQLMEELGHRAVAPAAEEGFKIHATDKGPVSNWSERHIAYAAGLGTFSINDGFITEKGIAVRFCSIITDLKLTPDVRSAESHTANCLLCSKGTCGACISRCPVGAITREGHDKIKCRNYVYGEESRNLAASYGGNPKTGSGCGLCQVKVPCEGRNPMRA